MAHRDRTQGVGFVYVDLAKLLAESSSKKDFVLHPQAGTAQVINLNRDTSIAPATSAPAKTPAERSNSELESDKAIQKIKENLDRLQSLHHRLHAVLAELNQVTANKKKSDLE